jgi:Skp family chaperone for outer membrane proteins
MTEHELKKLGRGQLLEILVRQSKELDRLQEELKAAEDKLADRRIRMEESGSIAEAALSDRRKRKDLIRKETIQIYDRA